MKCSLVFLLSTFLLSACNFSYQENASDENENVQTFQKTIERNRARSVRTEITMNAGVLRVRGGSRDLVNAKIEYTNEDWKPVISYATRNEQGKLIIKQPENGFRNINFGDDDTNQWEISLNEDIQQDMYLTVGAGSTEVDLKKFNLGSFSLDAGVGEYDINLSDTSVPDMEINAGIGEVSVNLTGKWKNNLRAEINGGIGELNLILPESMGIQMEISGGLGSVDAPRFNKDGNVYTNEAFGNAKYEMIFEINGGLGDVNVSLVE